MTVYYIGPESKVWHRRRGCRSLRREDRYHPLREATGAEAERVIAERRPCAYCARYRGAP